KYDVYEDRKAYDDYYAWTQRWIEACKRMLSPTGSFWIAIGDDYAAEVKIIAGQAGLHLRNWVIWHYTFGQQTKTKFARSHTHLFYFVNDPKQFTFNDKAVRTFSDRQRVYKDSRANTAGKIPDDTWNEFPRVCGTFGEREGWHPCQMPESVLTRIVMVSSNPGDVVYDPFAGSGTALVVAKRLSRKFIGTEISAGYVEKIAERLKKTQTLAAVEKTALDRWSPQHLQLLQGQYMSAAVSTTTLYENPALLAGFAQQFNWRVEHTGCKRIYSVQEIWHGLEQLRSQLRLGQIRVHADEFKNKKPRPLLKDVSLFGS
ncbi:MAG: site-specific DNA-methyltransferase, partial [Planctomycetes bacterium]|nr:site-specific DNA-methyltransferase [Planctomycetota bacterium]